MAWLTPDKEDFQEGMVSRMICFPYPLLDYVSGALVELSEVWNWEQSGTATPEDVSQFFLNLHDKWVNSEMAYVGMVSAFFVVPECWIELNGVGAYLRADYPELDAVLPASWKVGAFFNFPSMAARTLVGEGTYQGDTLDLGELGGEYTHTLTKDEMPAHSHTYTPPQLDIDLETPGAPSLQAASVGLPQQTGDTGGGEPHNNTPLYAALRWAIYAGR